MKSPHKCGFCCLVIKKGPCRRDSSQDLALLEDGHLFCWHAWVYKHQLTYGKSWSPEMSLSISMDRAQWFEHTHLRTIHILLIHQSTITTKYLLPGKNLISMWETISERKICFHQEANNLQWLWKKTYREWNYIFKITYQWIILRARFSGHRVHKWASEGNESLFQRSVFFMIKLKVVITSVCVCVCVCVCLCVLFLELLLFSYFLCSVLLPKVC